MLILVYNFIAKEINCEGTFHADQW